MISRVENVLATRHPSVTDENAWEEFTLTDAKAFVPGKRRFASILSASEETPVCVVGKLEVLEKQQRRLVRDKKYESKHVLIENVTYYAYGQTRDGQVVIWVAGAPGWFAISPSKTYKAIYYEMVEAINLLYFTADKHQRTSLRGRRQKTWNPKVNFLFNEYSKYTLGTYEDEEESAEFYYKNHEFLMMEMLKGKEDINWSNTPIFAHLRDRFPETFTRLRQYVDANASASDYDDDEDDNAGDTSDSDEDMGGGLSRAVSLSAQKAQADSIFAAVRDIKDSVGASKRRLNIRSIAETLFARYEIASVDYAIDLIRARAQLLLELMDKSSTAHFMWASRAIYLELQAVETNGHTGTVGNTPLHPRLNSHAKSKSANSEDSEGSEHITNDSDDEGDDDDDDDDETPPPTRRRAPKSILRPRPTKSLGKRAASKGGGKWAANAAAKGKNRMQIDGGNAHVNGDVDDEDDYLSEESDYSGATTEDTPSRMQGLEELLDMEIQSSNGETEDGRDSIAHTPANASRAGEDQSNGEYTGLNNKIDCDTQERLHNPEQAANDTGADESEEESEEQHFAAGLSHAAASYPNLPVDTWVCPTEGCVKTIYKASNRYSRDLINDHSLSHANDVKSRINLVLSEQKHNVGLSVSHLVDRIKESARDRWNDGEMTTEDARDSPGKRSQETSPSVPKRLRSGNNAR